jgi:hypothetical protein
VTPAVTVNGGSSFRLKVALLLLFQLAAGAAQNNLRAAAFSAIGVATKP